MASLPFPSTSCVQTLHHRAWMPMGDNSPLARSLLRRTRHSLYSTAVAVALAPIRAIPFFGAPRAATPAGREEKEKVSMAPWEHGEHGCMDDGERLPVEPVCPMMTLSDSFVLYAVL